MSDEREVYYIILRGAGRQALFNNDADRHHFTRVTAEAAVACGVTVHAYCWLASEARLAAQCGSIPLREFAQRIGETSQIVPPVEQHYREVRVDGRTALPELVRHIHLAPLKAGLTDRSLSYPWSSHAIYLGLASAPWLATEPTLQFLRRPGDADSKAAYREFMERGFVPDPLVEEDVPRHLFR